VGSASHCATEMRAAQGGHIMGARADLLTVGAGGCGIVDIFVARILNRLSQPLLRAARRCDEAAK